MKFETGQTSEPTSANISIVDWIRFSRKKSCLFWVDWSPDAGFSLLPCHYTMKEGERGPFSPKLRVRIKDNNSSPHGKFHRFLFPFSSKFPDLNIASYVLYIYQCGTHSEPGLPVVLSGYKAHARDVLSVF